MIRCPSKRRATWVNAYSIAELEGVFERAHWTVKDRIAVGFQCIWKLTRR